jgi:hypothetical protein
MGGCCLRKTFEPSQEQRRIWQLLLTIITTLTISAC